MQLREQEEQLRMEEEAFYEAKRQAARVGRRLKSQELAAKQAAAKKSIHQTWLGKDAEEYEMYALNLFRKLLSAFMQSSTRLSIIIISIIIILPIHIYVIQITCG